MSKIFYQGSAVAVAQIWKGSITTTTTGHTYTLPMTDEAGNAYTFSYALVGGDTTTTIAAASWATAWNASSNAFLTGITASSTTNQVILTADALGTPFYPGTPGGTGTWSGTGTTTPNAGPADWGSADNWSGGAVPVNGDEVTLDGRGTTAIIYGLDQSAVTLSILYHYVGAPACGTVSAAIKIGATTAYTNIPATQGSTAVGQLANFNWGTAACNWTNYPGSNYAGGNGLPGTMGAGSNSTNAFTNLGGAAVGIGLLTPGQACNWPTIKVKGGTLFTGSGVTWAAGVNNGGNWETYGGSGSTLTNTAGTTTIYGTASVGTVNADGGTVKPLNRTLAIGVLNLNGGAVDFSENSAAFTVTTVNIKDGGGSIKKLTAGQSTYTNKFADALAARTTITFGVQ